MSKVRVALVGWIEGGAERDAHVFGGGCEPRGRAAVAFPHDPHDPGLGPEVGPEADPRARVGLYLEAAVGARRGLVVAQVLAVGQNIAVAAVEAHQHDGAGQRLAVGPVHDRARAVSWILGPATLALIGLVSLITPFLEPLYLSRWFSTPNNSLGVLKKPSINWPNGKSRSRYVAITSLQFPGNRSST